MLACRVRYALEKADDRFPLKALTLNSLPHRDDPRMGLREVHRVLVPTATLLIGLRGATPAHGLEHLLSEARFRLEQVELLSSAGKAATLVLARPAQR